MGRWTDMQRWRLLMKAMLSHYCNFRPNLTYLLSYSPRLVEMSQWQMGKNESEANWKLLKTIAFSLSYPCFIPVSHPSLLCGGMGVTSPFSCFSVRSWRHEKRAQRILKHLNSETAGAERCCRCGKKVVSPGVVEELDRREQVTFLLTVRTFKSIPTWNLLYGQSLNQSLYVQSLTFFIPSLRFFVQ